MNASTSMLMFALAVGIAQDAGPAKQPEPAKLRFTFKLSSRDNPRVLAFSPDGSRIASAGWDGGVRVWDADKGVEIFAITIPEGDWARLAFSPDGNSLLVGGPKGAVRILDAAKGTTQGELKGNAGYVGLLQFLDDGKTLVIGDSDGSIEFWDFAARSKLPDRALRVEKHAQSAITPDGNVLVTSAYSKDAYLIETWDTAARKKIARIETPVRSINATALSPDGKTLVVFGYEIDAQIWDLPAKKVGATLIGHERGIRDVKITRDGKSIITGGYDNRIKVWDLNTGGERMTIQNRRAGGSVETVAVSADGKLIAAGDASGVSVWQLPKPVSQFESRLVKAKPKITKKDGPELTPKEREAIHVAVQELSQQGAKGAVELAKKMREPNIEWRWAAGPALRSMGPDAEPALDALIEGLRADNAHVKWTIVSVIRAIGPKAKRAVPQLIEAGKDMSAFDGGSSKGGPSNLTQAVIEAVRALDPDALPGAADALLPGLMDVVENGNMEAVPSALRALRVLGVHARPALPKLRASMPDLPDRVLGEALPIFQDADEEGMRLFADFFFDPKTSLETKRFMMESYSWEQRTAPPSTVRILRALLADKALPTRVMALKNLRIVTAKEMIPDLVALLPNREIVDYGFEKRDYEPYIVAAALARQGKDALPALIKALELEDNMARYQAARALAEMGKNAVEARPALEAVLNDEIPMIGPEAARALLRQDQAKAQALTKFRKHLHVDDMNLSSALYGLRDLGAAGRPLVPSLKKVALEAKDQSVRNTAFMRIIEVRADSKEVVQLWVRLVKEETDFVNHRVTDAVREHPAEALGAVPVLLKVLQQDDRYRRNRAFELLTAMGPHAKDALPALIKILEADSDHGREALRTIWAMGPDAKPAVPVLIRMYEEARKDSLVKKEKGKSSDSAYRRESILFTLGHIGPGAVEAVPQLIQSLPEEPYAAFVLGKIGPAAKDALPAIEKQYRNGSPHEKVLAAFALVKLTGKTEPYVAELATALKKTKDRNVRSQYLEVLDELGLDGRAALPVVVAIVNEKVDGFQEGFMHDPRGKAAKVLRHFGADAKDALPGLLDMIAKNHWEARTTAIEALSALGPAAKDAIPVLEKLVKEDEGYAAAAQKALAKIR